MLSQKFSANTFFAAALAVSSFFSHSAQAATVENTPAPVGVDIMFVVDQSGSMQNAFNTLSSSISTFVNGLNASSQVSSVSFGLTTYEDASKGTTGDCFSGPCLDLSQSLTQNLASLTTALSNAAAGVFGGTEDPLSAIDALLPGGELFNAAGWRNDTVKTFVLITDENADDRFNYTNEFGTGYAALGAKLDAENYLNNIITLPFLFGEYEPAARPNADAQQALFNLNEFTGNNADPNAFLSAFADAKLAEVATGTPTDGSVPASIPLPATVWMLIAALGGIGGLRSRKA